MQFIYSYYLLEPTGQTVPKVSGDGLNKQIGISGSIIGLLCDAQAFPAPKKRYQFLLLFKYFIP